MKPENLKKKMRVERKKEGGKLLIAFRFRLHSRILHIFSS